MIEFSCECSIFSILEFIDKRNERFKYKILDIVLKRFLEFQFNEKLNYCVNSLFCKNSRKSNEKLTKNFPFAIADKVLAIR